MFADQIGVPTPFLMYFGAVLLASWFGGLWAGLGTTFAGGVLGKALFLDEPASPGAAWVTTGLFFVDGAIASAITARLRVERGRARDNEHATRQAFERLNVVMDAVDEGITVQQPDGRLVYANDIAARLVGFDSAEKFLQAPIAEVMQRFEMFDEDGAPFPLDQLPARVLFQGGRSTERRVRFRVRGSEQSRWSIVRANPIRDPDGKVVLAVNLFRDVTARHQQEEALRLSRESEDLQRAFLTRATEELDSSLDYRQTLATVARLAVPTIADWCAVDVLEGDQLVRLAVAHVDEAKIRFVEEVQRRYPPDPSATTGVRNILRTGQPEMMADIPEALLIAAAKDDEHRDLILQLMLRSYIGVPLKRGEQTVGVITLVMAESGRRYHDQDRLLVEALAERAGLAVEKARLFSEQVAARQALDKARIEAELANRSKDEFLAILGHELRNPLAPILTALQIMKLRGRDTFERERTIIERQVRHVVRLVDDLLDVSRITRGKVTLEKEPVDVGEVVARAIEMAGPLLEQRGHQIERSVGEPLFVHGNAVRLAQVVSNLLNNAAKYTDPGGRIRISAVRDGEWVQIVVSDRGIGISPEMLPRIFDLFVQEKQALDRSAGGLGLGLAIVKSLVGLHGGTVTAHSDGLAQGSEFAVRLPVLEAGLPLRAVSPSLGPVARSGGTRVLVVDDNVDAVELLSNALQLLGHDPQRAYDGPSALTLAADVKPTIALLDIGLPVMDGYELARRLRQISGLEGLKLVAVTGYGQESDRARTAAAGFDEHLVKPIGLEVVRSVIDRLTG